MPNDWVRGIWVIGDYSTCSGEVYDYWVLRPLGFLKVHGLWWQAGTLLVLWRRVS